MVDLDGFKDVNDAYGHATGDEVLKQASQRLEQAVRRDDLVARLGGDEFVILQMDTYSNTAARKLAERMRRDVSAPYFVAGHEIVIDVSAGIKISRHGGGDAEHALQEADQALYRVKRTGSGGFQFA
jgi:diguanylate cyclase (GGDEF)-like protein